MKYRITFADVQHPPVEVECRPDTIRVLSLRRVKLDTATLTFPEDMSRITDQNGREVWSATGR